jgi:hypothetical protein
LSSDEPFFHVGIVVADIGAAQTELTAALGLHWQPVWERPIENATLRVTYSIEGPPFIELIEANGSTDWDASGGPHLDHLGYFSDDVDADGERLAAQGIAVSLDGAGRGLGPWRYHRAPRSGLQFELIGPELRAQMEATWERHA